MKFGRRKYVELGVERQKHSMWKALPNSSILGSCFQGASGFPERLGLEEQGTKQLPAFGVLAPLLAAARVWKKLKWDQPDKDLRET